MSKFKVGERITRIRGEWAGMKAGDTATVVACLDGALRLKEYAGVHAPHKFALVGEAPVVCSGAQPSAEADPNGTDPHTPGAKLDAGKVEMGLILNGMPRALLQIARVGTYGANKYTRDGWLSVPDGPRRYTDAMYRHLNAEARGEVHDADTGLEHAAHAAWNALARLELLLRGKGTA